MTTMKQVKANRENAKESTGPRTPAGKAAVRLNALTHGLLSRQTLLPSEDGAALAELAEALRAELQPVGVMEELLVDSITASAWRLRRLSRVEAGIFVCTLLEIRVERAERKAKTYEQPVVLEFEKRTTITDKEKHERALLAARKARALQAKIAAMGLAFIKDASDANAFSKLSRYETALVRSFFRTFHELQRLQAARTGTPVLPPVAVDINVSGDSAEAM